MKIYKMNLAHLASFNLLVSLIFYMFIVLMSVNGNAKTENCFSIDQKGRSQNYENGNYFASIKNYDFNLIKTAMSAMTHSCMITQKESRETLKLLSSRGWAPINENGLYAKTPKEGIIEPSAGRAYVAYNKKINTLVVVFRGTGVKGIGEKAIN